MGLGRIQHDPYTFATTTLGPSAPKLGTVFVGVDNTLGLEAHFRFIQHLNAVTVVSGHAAAWCVVPTGASGQVTSGGTVTNDVSGGATASLLIAAGAYCRVLTAGQYGYVQTWGFHPTLLGDGSVAITESFMLKASADGTWDSFTGAVPQCGDVWADDSGSPTTFPGFLRIA